MTLKEITAKLNEQIEIITRVVRGTMSHQRISFWTRIGIVVSIIWFGSMLIANSVTTWFVFSLGPHHGSYSGPGTKVTLIGLAMIWIARIGIAWILRAE